MTATSQDYSTLLAATDRERTIIKQFPGEVTTFDQAVDRFRLAQQRLRDLAEEGDRLIAAFDVVKNQFLENRLAVRTQMHEQELVAKLAVLAMGRFA